ncbi:Ribose-phosphate pyrophosphokinase 1 [Lecanosticta acicola]|uniref:Ribose-phosphate pyrophosphokinase 1 n=1 Tax=Lecanosticta acicola TaxID=111012 RepID=A0AAI8YYU9_9PEZI|nr:Ribose-phosphate pyrophosphokinase 1 [Lecanosticta acicola]
MENGEKRGTKRKQHSLSESSEPNLSRRKKIKASLDVPGEPLNAKKQAPKKSKNSKKAKRAKITNLSDNNVDQNAATQHDGSVSKTEKNLLAASPSGEPAVVPAKRKKSGQKKKKHTVDAGEKKLKEEADRLGIMRSVSLAGSAANDPAVLHAKRKAKRDKKRQKQREKQRLNTLEKQLEGGKSNGEPSTAPITNDHQVTDKGNATVVDINAGKVERQESCEITQQPEESVALDERSENATAPGVTDEAYEKARKPAKRKRRRAQKSVTPKMGESPPIALGSMRSQATPKTLSTAQSHPLKKLNISRPVGFMQRFECPPDHLRRSSCEEMEAWNRSNEDSESESDSDLESLPEERPKFTSGSWHESWANLINADLVDASAKQVEADPNDSDAVYEMIHELSESVLGDHGVSVEDCKPEPEQSVSGPRDALTHDFSAEDAENGVNNGLNSSVELAHEYTLSRLSTPPPTHELAHVNEERPYYSPRVLIPLYSPTAGDGSTVRRETEERAETKDSQEADEATQSTSAPAVVPPPRVLIPPPEPGDLVPGPSTPKLAQSNLSIATPKGGSYSRRTPKSRRSHTGAISKFFIDNRVDVFNTTSSSRKVPAGTSTAPSPPIFAATFGLIQEETWREPFWLLVAVTLLNRTTGRAAVPVYKQIKARFPTPEDLAKAEYDHLLEMVGHLGLQRGRTRNLIELAKTWVDNPPVVGKLYRKRDYPTKGDGMAADVANVVEEDMPLCQGAIEIGHLRGCGAYAYDSWRIFCRDALRGVAEDYNGKGATEEGFVPEWKRVVPKDKELRACLRWMWLREGYIWNPITGEKRPAGEEEMKRAELGTMEFDDTQEAKFSAQAAGVGISPQKQLTADPLPRSQEAGGGDKEGAGDFTADHVERNAGRENVVGAEASDDGEKDEKEGIPKRERRMSTVSNTSSRRKTPVREVKAVRSIEPPDTPPATRTRSKVAAKQEESSRRGCAVA